MCMYVYVSHKSIINIFIYPVAFLAPKLIENFLFDIFFGIKIAVASCKERWRNIRAAFARSINIYKTHSGPNRVKPYYLHKELSFLVKPMMEGRDKRDDYDESQDGGAAGVKYEENGDDEVAEEEDADEPDEAAEEEEDFADDTADVKSAFEGLNPDVPIQPETSYQTLLRNSNNTNNDLESSGIFEPHTEFTTHSENELNFTDDSLNQVEGERRMNHQIVTQNGLKRPMHLEMETFDNKRLKLLQTPHPANENDVRFLEALLPDMELMNTKQKIIFKRKIYQTLEEVFENSNDFPNIGRHNNEHKSNLDGPNANEMANGHNNTNNINNYNVTPTSAQAQVRQTVLTVNSSIARSIINNIANLNEMELQKVNGFLQSSLRHQMQNSRLNNSSAGPSTAAAKLMSSTPKITITKVNCPPPAALRNLSLAKPPSPSPATVSTTIHNTCSAVISSNVHSTTSPNPGKVPATHNGSSAAHSNSPWTQLLPITIKDEIEDVDIV